MKKISRKKFIKQSSLATASILTASACANDKLDESGAPAILKFKSYKWKMVTTWPPNFPIVGEVCTLFSKWVEEMSGGQLRIKVYGGGELVPALEAFDAVTSGAAEMANGVSYYWAGKAPAAQFFASVPFGMNAQQMNAWLYAGGGLELYREVYEKFNLIPFLGGNTGVQMGGWFNREINSVADLKGLKMRIPGLGGKVLEKVGGTAVVSAGSEIYTNLERGVIDATEWIGPYHDLSMGFYKIAKYYYYPGWHEPGSNLEYIVNKRKFEALPLHLQQIIETATYRSNHYVLSQFEAKNNQALQELIEKGVELKQFPDEVLQVLKEKTEICLDELAASDEMAKKVYASFKSFKEGISNWSRYTEKVFHNYF